MIAQSTVHYPESTHGLTVIGGTISDDADWTPPENPDAQEILNEAARDSRAGRYSIALAKHIWFHENSLRLRPSFSGVRLSFALGYWHVLADSYPPAMDALRQALDKAASQFLQSGFGFPAFHDLAALSRELDAPERTVEAFKAADSTDQNVAFRIYHIAQPYLVRYQEYALCGRYIDPKSHLDFAIRIYELTRIYETERSGRGPHPPKTARRRFVQAATTLVALLVKNNRIKDANWVADAARLHLNDGPFNDDLASTLTGNVPTPWP